MEYSIDIGALIISIISLALSFYWSRKAKQESEKANKISQEANKISLDAKKISEGQIELQINERISSSKDRLFQINIEIAKTKQINALKGEVKLNYEKQVNAIVEDNLNAYDEACAKYLDYGKVDRERFKKNYHLEIHNLFENEPFKSKLLVGAGHYDAIKAVHDEWFNLEK